MDYSEIQKKLLWLLPVWNYMVAKPFKQLLAEGISLEMYYCITTLESAGGTATMGQIAKWSRMPKQQMTKMVNKLVEQQFVTRFDDPKDRRIVKIQLTEKASEYIDHFLEADATCFDYVLTQMNNEELADFDEALGVIQRIFSNLPSVRACQEAGRAAIFEEPETE